MYVFDTMTNIWKLIEKKHGISISARESFTINYINGFIYIFGGQGYSVGNKDIFYKDLYKIKMDVHSNGRNFSIYSKEIKSSSIKSPSPRASHSAITY